METVKAFDCDFEPFCITTDLCVLGERAVMDPFNVCRLGNEAYLGSVLSSLPRTHAPIGKAAAGSSTK